MLDEPGEYEIRVSAAEATTGEFELKAVLGATIEREPSGEQTNDSVGAAESIDAGFFTTNQGVGRWAVFGTNGAADFYAVNSQPGEVTTLVLSGPGAAGMTLEVVDQDGAAIAATAVSSGANELVLTTVGVDGNDYFARVSGGTGAEYTLAVIPGATVEIEGNDQQDSAQVLPASLDVVGRVDERAFIGVFAYDAATEEIVGVDPETGNIIGRFQSPITASSSNGVGMAATSTTLLIGGPQDQPIFEIDPSTGETLRTINNPGVEIASLAYLNQEITVAESGFVEELIVLDYASGQVVRTLPYQTSQQVFSTISAIGASEDELLAAEFAFLGIEGFETQLRTVDPQSGLLSPRLSLSPTATYTGMTVVGDEVFLADAGLATVEVFNLLTGGVRSLPGGPFPYLALASNSGSEFDIDNYRFYAAEGDTLQVEVVSLEALPGEPTNQLLPTIELIDPSGDPVPVGDDGSTINHVAALPGAYTVRVAGASETSGDYRLTVQGNTGQPPDDSPDVAPPTVATVSIRVDEFTATINGESRAPISIPAGANPSFVIGFSEPMAATLDASDLLLSGERTGEVSITEVSYDPTRMELSFETSAETILEDDLYELTLRSGDGRAEDIAGNDLDGDGDGSPGGDFVYHFDADIDVVEAVTPNLSPVEPLVSLISSSQETGYVGGGDASDRFAVSLDAGDIITARVMPGDTLAPTLTVRGSDGSVLAEVSASAAGEVVVLNAIPAAPEATDVTVEVSQAETAGTYDVEILVNAAVEQQPLSEAVLESLDPEGRLRVSRTRFDVFVPGNPVEFDFSGGPASFGPGTIEVRAVGGLAGATFTVGETVVVIPASEVAPAPAPEHDSLEVWEYDVPAETAAALLSGALVASLEAHRDQPRVEGALNGVTATLAYTPDNSQDLTNGLVSLTGDARVGAVIGVADGRPQSIVTVYSEGFDVGDSGFVIDNTFGSGSGLWNVTRGRSSDGDPNHSPAFSLYFGTREDIFGNGTYEAPRAVGGAARSPVVSLPSSDSIQLSFNSLIEVEPNFERLAVRVVDSLGGRTTVLASAAFGGNSDRLPDDTSQSWQSFDVDLTRFSGQDVQIEFTFDTVDDIANFFEGWYVDDLLVTANVVDFNAAATDDYRFELAAGESAEIVLTSAAAGDVSFEVVDASAQPVAVGQAAADNPSRLTAEVTGPGAYFARVSGAQAVEYSLLVMPNALFETEPNGTFLEAQRIAVGNVVLGELPESAGGDDDGDPVAAPSPFVNLSDGNGFLWNMGRDGRIRGGTGDVYSGGLELVGYPQSGADVTTENGGREVVYAAQFGDLTATRKVYVSGTEGFARFLETFTNDTDEPVTQTVTIESGLNFDTELSFTSSGDAEFSADDNWLVTDAGLSGFGVPVLAHVIAGDAQRPSQASALGGIIRFSYDLTLAPGETQSILHFASQNQDLFSALTKALDLTDFFLGALDGLSQDELRQVVNFNLIELIERDYYAFASEAGDQLSIEARALPTPGVGGLEFSLELFDPFERLVESTIGTTDSGASIRHAAMETGDYRVVITGLQGPASDYLLSVSKVDGSDSPSLAATAPVAVGTGASTTVHVVAAPLQAANEDYPGVLNAPTPAVQPSAPATVAAVVSVEPTEQTAVGPQDVLVFWQDSTGGFEEATRLSTSLSGAGVLVAEDFNADARADIAVVGVDGVSSFIFEAPSRSVRQTFSPEDSGLEGPLLAGVGDYDQDGALDIVVVAAATGGIGRYAGDGAGGFSFDASPMPSLGAPVTDIVAGFVDSDSNIDLVLASDSSQVTIWRLHSSPANRRVACARDDAVAD